MTVTITHIWVGLLGAYLAGGLTALGIAVVIFGRKPPPHDREGRW